MKALLRFALVLASVLFLVATGSTLTPVLGQSLSAPAPVKHYGYSGQDKMLECIQRVFGRYAAGLRGTVLFGHPPIDDSTMKVVDGRWQPVKERTTFPPATELACPKAREEIEHLLNTDVAKLLFVPPNGETESVRMFETAQWVYIIPGSKFKETPYYQERQRWKRIRIET
jgi:hypothetical protein